MAVFFLLASAAESRRGRALWQRNAITLEGCCGVGEVFVEIHPHRRFVVSKLDEEFHGLALLDVAPIADGKLDKVLVPVAHDGQVESLCVRAISNKDSRSTWKPLTVPMTMSLSMTSFLRYWLTTTKGPSLGACNLLSGDKLFTN